MMSNVSIFEKKWIDLVFEGKNKEYGAYQLRQNNPRTTSIAFLWGLFFIMSLSGLGFLLSSFSSKTPADLTHENCSIPIHLSNVKKNKPNLPKGSLLPLEKDPKVQNLKSNDLTHYKIVKATDNDVDTSNKKNPILPVDNLTDSSGMGSSLGGNGFENTGGMSGLGTADKNIANTIMEAKMLDVMPDFPGGMDKFYQYVGTHFEKPEIEMEKTVTVYVSFVIEKDGALSNIKVLQDPGYGLAKEAIRVLSSLKTKWKPGMLAGEKVRTAYNLPIAVKME